MPKGKLWQLKKTLYELIDAARQLYDCIEEVFVNLDMTQSQVDPDCTIWRGRKRLSELLSFILMTLCIWRRTV